MNFFVKHSEIVLNAVFFKKVKDDIKLVKCIL